MLDTLKEEVCEQNIELPRNGLVVGSGGNVSGRDPESGLIVIKPSGVHFSRMTPETMVVVDLDGKVVEGRLKPSVDTGIHLYVYRHRDDVLGVAHTHSPYATSFAGAGRTHTGGPDTNHPHHWTGCSLFAVRDTRRGRYRPGDHRGGRRRPCRAGQGSWRIHDGKVRN